MTVEKINKKALIFSVIFILLSSSVFAVDQLMALQGKVTSGGSLLSSGNVTVMIYDNETGGTLMYDSGSIFNNSVSGGYYDLMLGSAGQNLTLNYSQKYWLDLVINSEDFDFSGAERKQFYSSVGLISTDDFLNDFYVNQSGDTMTGGLSINSQQGLKLYDGAGPNFLDIHSDANLAYINNSAGGVLFAIDSGSQVKISGILNVTGLIYGNGSQLTGITTPRSSANISVDGDGTVWYNGTSGTTYSGSSKISVSGSVISYNGSIGNSSLEIWNTIANGSYQSEISANCDNQQYVRGVLDNGTLVCVAEAAAPPPTNYYGTENIEMIQDGGNFRVHYNGTVGNTTEQIFAVANNGSFFKKNTDRVGNTSAEIWAVITNGTYQYEISANCGVGEVAQGILDNGTLVCVAASSYTNQSPITLAGTTFGLISCGENNILKVQSGSWGCIIDSSYYESENIEMLGGNSIHYNGTIGNTTNQIYTAIDNGTYFKKAVDRVGNTSTEIQAVIYGSSKIAFSSGVITYNGTGGNSTVQIHTAIDNNTYFKKTDVVGNTTAQIYNVIANGTYVKVVGDTMTGNLVLDNNLTIGGVIKENTSSIYFNGISTEGLKLNMHFDENTKDYSGYGNDGTTSGTPSHTTGKYGSGMYFDGTDDFVQVADNSNVEVLSQLTLAGWLKKDATTAQTIVSKWKAGNLAYVLTAHTAGSPANSAAFTISSSCAWGGVDGPNSWNVYSNYALITGQWHHVVGTFNSGTMKIYVDGQLRNTRTGVNLTICNTGTAPVTIGSDGDGSSDTNGTVDEVMIFNRSLSDNEVLQLYQAKQQVNSKTLYYSSYNIQATPNGAITYNGSAGNTTNQIYTAIDNGTYFKKSDRIGNTTGEIYNVIANGTYVKIVGDAMTGDLNLSDNYLTNTSSIKEVSTQGLMLYMPFEDASSNVLTKDWSDRKYDGTLVNNPAVVPGKVGKGFLFDSTNYINITHLLLDNANGSYLNGTLSLWFKPTTTIASADTDYKVLFTKDTASWGGTGIIINHGHINFLIQTNGVGYTADGSDQNWNAGQWYHVTTTWGSTGMFTYIDGTPVGTNAYVGTWFEPEDLIVSIGGYFDNNAETFGYPFNGTIDEVRVYNRSLTPTEVRTLYQMGANNKQEIGGPWVSRNDVYTTVSGNVGIGTTNPVNTLNIVGNTNTTGQLYVGQNITMAGTTNVIFWNNGTHLIID